MKSKDVTYAALIKSRGMDVAIAEIYGCTPQSVLSTVTLSSTPEIERSTKSLLWRVNKLFKELYGSVDTTLTKQYHQGITVNIPYVKDVVFTTTTTAAVYDAQGVLVSPASTTTTATKLMGTMVCRDGVVTAVN